MTKRILPVLAATLVLAALPAPALARARPSDVAATRVYIQADYTLVHKAKLNLATSEAALQTLHNQISSECPGVAAGSPQDTDSEQLSNELVGTMALAAIAPDVHAIAQFVQTVQRLHWSNGQLAHKVHVYASRLQTLAMLPAPNVCSDVRAWVADGFRTLPASSIEFDQHYYKVEVGVGEVPAKLLAPSEQRSERSVLAHAEQLEGQLTEAEANGVYTWGHIMDVMGLNP